MQAAPELTEFVKSEYLDENVEDAADRFLKGAELDDILTMIDDQGVPEHALFFWIWAGAGDF
jgi:hypothetical protein